MYREIFTYIGLHMREKRKKVGFTLKYISSILGISIKQLQEYECATSKISASRLFQIAQILGVSLDYFFTGFDRIKKSEAALSKIHIRPDRFCTLNILLIEDDDSDVYITRRAFQNSAIKTEILVINESKEIFKFLHNEKPNVCFSRPDIILLDLNLPRKDGVIILKSIKEDRRISDIPVVVLSDSLSKDLMVECYKQHASGYICKPLDFNVYSRKIDEMAHYWARAVVLPNRQINFME